MKRITLINGIILFLTTTISIAQGGLYEIDLKQQINNSEFIVEGKVISKKSFWDKDFKLIYTLNTIEVFKTFKGETNTLIDVLTMGGTVGDTGLSVSHNLELSENEEGMFLLNSSNKQLTGSKTDNTQYRAYSGLQGFYKYDTISNKVSNAFEGYGDIENEFYQTLETLTEKKFTELKKRVSFSKNNASKSQLAIPFVNNYSPTTAAAGIGTEITITGFNFGATKGKVQFRDANESQTDPLNPRFIDALDSEITNWTNTSITVKVPSNAGSGTLRVRNSDGFSGANPAITIPYAIQNRSSGIMMQHYDTNGSGGYTWQMSSEFNNSTAKAPFLRAFNTVVCATGINWVMSSTNVSGGGFFKDGINIVAFDPPGNEFAAGVLGAALNWTTTCATGVVIEEIDFVFDNERSNWNYGPAPASSGEIDFETVALHELGHGHSFAHVTTPGDLMFRSVANGVTNRTFGNSNLDAGNFINNESVNNVQCAKPLMNTIACPSLSLNKEILEQAINIFPNPSNGIVFVKNNSSVNLEKVFIYDIGGRLIFENELSDASTTKTINLQGMSKGVYFVKITSDLAEITRKIIML
jgi:hypothetical protein